MPLPAPTAPEPRDAAERRWAVEAAGGSLRSFEQIVRAYQGPLLRFLRRRTGNLLDAEDVLQETFVCAFRKIAQYDPRWRLSGWLFSIAVRQAATHHRRMRVAPPPPAFASGPSDPADVVVERDERANLWSVAREHLSSDQFDALWLYYVEGLAMPDLARALGRSRLTAKVVLHRARQRLKGHLTRAEKKCRQPRSSSS